jgi:ankyrin repeat protein
MVAALQPPELHSTPGGGGMQLGRLHKAAAEGDTAALASLLTEGVDINARDEHGYTPLIWAAAQRRFSAARILATKM